MICEACKPSDARCKHGKEIQAARGEFDKAEAFRRQKEAEDESAGLGGKLVMAKVEIADIKAVAAELLHALLYVEWQGCRCGSYTEPSGCGCCGNEESEGHTANCKVEVALSRARAAGVGR
jgi:hypothetical protein